MTNKVRKTTDLIRWTYYGVLNFNLKFLYCPLAASIFNGTSRVLDRLFPNLPADSKLKYYSKAVPNKVLAYSEKLQFKYLSKQKKLEEQMVEHGFSPNISLIASAACRLISSLLYLLAIVPPMLRATSSDTNLDFFWYDTLLIPSSVSASFQTCILIA